MPRSLAGYLSHHALSAVETQRKFDAAYEASIVPVPRMRVGRFEVASEVTVSLTKTERWEIGVKPLNLSFRVARGLTENSDVRLSIEVEQVVLVRRNNQ